MAVFLLIIILPQIAESLARITAKGEAFFVGDFSWEYFLQK